MTNPTNSDRSSHRAAPRAAPKDEEVLTAAAAARDSVSSKVSDCLGKSRKAVAGYYCHRIGECLELDSDF